MKHIIALIIKTALVMFALITILSLANGYPIWNTLALTLIVVGASYIIGDLFLLHATNNTVSTIADFGLCTLVIWLIGPMVLNNPIPFILAVLPALLVGAGEWFFHKYVVNAVVSKNPKVYS